MFGPGTFFGIEISRRALQAEQQALSVVSHNMANAGNTGYTRQEAVHVASDPYCNAVLNQNVTYKQLGSGVEISYVRRYRDAYVDNQWRDVAGSLGYWQGLNSVLGKVEILFAEPDNDATEKTGLQNLIGKFFGAWEDLNNGSNNEGVKAAVSEWGEALTRAVRETYAQLEDVKSNTETMVEDSIGRVNEIVAQIQDVSKSINRVLMLGETPNDLLDKRDLLLDELSQLGVMETHTNYPENGFIGITICGVELLNGNNEKTVELTLDNANDWRDKQDPPAQKSALIGYLTALDDIEGYLADLNELAVGFIQSFNYLHNDGNHPNFFQGTGASSFYLSEEVKASVTNINSAKAIDIAGLRGELTMSPKDETEIVGSVTSLDLKVGEINGGGIVFDINGERVKVTFSDVTNELGVVEQINAVLGNAGKASWDNGGNLVICNTTSQSSKIEIMEIIDVPDGPDTDPTNVSVMLGIKVGYSATVEYTTTLEGFYNALVTRIGADTAASADRLNTQQYVMAQVDDLRESLIGVSEEDELVKTIQYQRSYEASSRMITVMDSLLDTLINRTAV